MAAGDVVLTPNWCWHGHGNDGNVRGYWLDFLDVPLMQLARSHVLRAASRRFRRRRTRKPGAAYGADLEAVKRRLHVIDRQGALPVGVPAFAALWDEIPRYRVFARLVRLPVVRSLAAALYELLAAVLYAWNKRRERRRALACGTAPRRGGSP